MTRSARHRSICSAVALAMLFSSQIAFTIENRAGGEDVLRILQQARDAARAINEDAFLRENALRGIAAGQAEVGGFDAALEAAALIEDEYIRTDAWRHIAIAQARAGDRASAGKLLDKVLQTVTAFKNVHLIRVEALVATAEAQAQIGNVPGAIKTAVGVGNLHAKAEGLRKISIVQARAGDLKGALETAATIVDERMKAQALKGIATARAEAGDREGALQTAAGIRDPYLMAGALRKIAVAPPILKDRTAALDLLGQALNSARTIQDENEKVDAVGAIALAYAEAGDVPGAVKTVSTIEGIFAGKPFPDTAVTTKAEALRGIAIAQAKAGDIRGALQTARSIMNPYMQVSALAEIAGAQAERGDRNAAVGTVRKAAQSASLVQEIYVKGPALLAVAEGQAKIGERAAAVKTFRQARHTVRVSADERYKAEALMELAMAQSRAGDFSGAVDTADGIQDVYAQASTWRGIAAAQGVNGNPERVLAWVAKQGSFIKKAYALLGVAEGLASPTGTAGPGPPGSKRGLVQ